MLWIMQIITKLTCRVFMSSNNFFIIFFTDTEMSKDFEKYQNNKERLHKKAPEIYESLSKEKNKQQYGREQYKDLLADEKQKLLEYRKKYHKMRKTPYHNYKKLLF